MSGTFLQGRYQPKNPQKYKGDPNNIVFRSSWELVAFKFCDLHPAIKFWSSEETVIPYVSPADNRVHRYFMDLKVWTSKPDSEELQISLIEIKPSAQLKEPRKSKSAKESTYINALQTWYVNSAKWDAARKLCEKEGWQFVFWTEKELDIEKDPDVSKRFRQRKQARQTAKKRSLRQQADIDKWRAFFKKEMGG